MTKQCNQTQTNSDLETTPANPQPPEIVGEMDIPLQKSQTNYEIVNLSKTSSLEEEITKFRFITGKKVLWVSMIAMGVSVVADILLSVFGIQQSSMLENLFEVFKLIAMTVLGYIFGSKTQ